MSENFRENKIKSADDLIGSELRKIREGKRLDLLEVAKETKINIKYLEAIELGDFRKLPKGVYGKRFIEEYAIYLGIDPQEMLTIYEPEYVNQKKKYAKRLFVKKVSKTHRFLTIPRIIKNSIIIFVIVVCVLYLGYYIKNIIEPPQLELLNLKEDTVFTKHNINIIGKTDKEAEVLVNDEIVLTDNEGNFTKEINLKTGLNVVSVEVQKKHSKKRIIQRNIIVK